MNEKPGILKMNMAVISELFRLDKNNG